MRIYEFCKQHNLLSKDVVQFLNEQGFSVSSHMSVLTDQMKDSIGKHLLKPPVQKVPEATKEATTAVEKTQPIISQPSKEKSPVQQQTTKPVFTAKYQQQKSQESRTVAAAVPITKSPLIIRPMMLGEFADYVGKPSSEIILTLLRQKIVANKNQVLSEKVIKDLAATYQISTQAAPVQQASAKVVTAEEESKNTVMRPPIVVVIGHVDHGKTSLLDYIRKTRVAAREKGGITQHLGAYDVPIKNGKIIFLDTPGHEAFSMIRVRGVSVADLAILVVAADDGVMPQTIEAIKQAQFAKIPLIVAINKIDKVDQAAVDRVKMQLAQYDVIVESWGGQVVSVPISAKLGTNVDQLLEMIALQAELMELKCSTEGAGTGAVLESKLEKGRGVVATIILKNGTAKVGDYFTAGNTCGHISSMVNSDGARVEQVGPTIPVAVAGFEGMPQPGDQFAVVSQEQYKQAKNAQQQPAVSLAQQMQAVSGDTVNLIIKSDANSSQEAIVNALGKISVKDAKKLSIVYAGIGNITQSDVDLAQIANATIYGFGVKAEPSVEGDASRLGVKIKLYGIIYQLLEAIEQQVEATLKPVVVTTKTGIATVRKVFDIKNIGVIAGCYVSEGKIVKGGQATVWRGKHKIGQGTIESLQRDKRAMKEVLSGFECAFIVQGHSDFQVDDRIECYVTQ